MRFFFSLMIFFFINLIDAQKIVEKSVLNDHVSLININSENCFEIFLETANTPTIIVSASMEGEYQKELLTQINEVGSTVFVSAGFYPTFTIPNDKLSAHKFVSISLHIVVPNHKNVKLYGKSSNVTVTGNYGNLDISLSNGICKLKNIGENVTAYTQSGSIFLENKSATIKSATSKYGKIYTDYIPKGNAVFNLSSVTGDIHILKTK